MDNIYIDLLTNKCMNLNRSKTVFISYNKEIKNFIDKLVKKLNEKGIIDIYKEEIDPQEKHRILKETTIKELENSPYFNSYIWDEYAKKDANFIIFETETPHLMDDISPEKLAIATKRRIETKPLYRKLQDECKLLWTIASYPGESWSKDIFNTENSYDLLKEKIYKMCMLDKKDPLKSWEEHITKQDNIITKLNNLNLEKLHYKNSLGTNLYIYLPKNYKYQSAKDNNGIIVNMPSYEIFTSPIYNKTEGIVYSSKPLIYNGALIEDFYLEFKEGKVISYNAKKGKDILKSIIETDEYSCYLGEAALVEKNSPIASMNINFKTTLIDENASCHLALGAGFSECIKNGLKMTEEELRKHGINNSKTHVDFMIGTPDLEIIGYTIDNNKIKIFENGEFSKELLDLVHN